jgi:hypothetical protein
MGPCCAVLRADALHGGTLIPPLGVARLYLHVAANVLDISSAAGVVVVSLLLCGSGANIHSMSVCDLVPLHGLPCEPGTVAASGAFSSLKWSIGSSREPTDCPDVSKAAK